MQKQKTTMQEINLEMNYGDITCKIVGSFNLEEHVYVVMIPSSSNNEIWLYELIEDDNEITFSPIEDNERFNIIAKTFFEIYNNIQEI